MFTSKQLVKQLASKHESSFVNLVLKASICHKSELPKKKVYRWPYETRSFNLGNFFLDPFTKSKFDENSKILLIEGNVGAEKEKFANRLANELGMYVMPKIDLDSYYVNEHGYDHRALNPLLPERLRACDWEMFHENPARHSNVHLQNFCYKLRLYQYIKALQHLFNTGQGVILVRSVFTEAVFVEAMHDLGWLPSGYQRGDGVRFYDFKARYNFIRNMTLLKVPKPHLSIYLDTPVETCLERKKNSKDPMIANSKAMVPEFLEGIKRAYEDIVLEKLNNNGHVLKVDAPQELTDDELGDVIDDIKKLDFQHDSHDTRFDDWYDQHYLWYFTNRRFYTNSSLLKLFMGMDQPWYDIAGLGDSITQADLQLKTSLVEAHSEGFGRYPFAYDINFSSFLEVLGYTKNFGLRMDRHVRSDFT